MLAAAAGLLARSNDGEGVKSGPLGLAVILVLCVACYFLFKSMSKHMRRVREDFPADEPRGTSAASSTGSVDRAADSTSVQPRPVDTTSTPPSAAPPADS